MCMDLDFIKLKSCIFLCIFCLSKLPLVTAHLIVDIDLFSFLEYYHYLYVCIIKLCILSLKEFC